MKYLIRLDDACDTMNSNLWNRMEDLLDRYNISPIVGVIPKNEDETLMIDNKDSNFYEKVKKWEKKDWAIAMHGYNHIYISEAAGINPVHKRSEFAGVEYAKQKEMLQKGYEILQKKNIIPEIFFAPSHTFDENTLKALKEITRIRIISDTVANDIYMKNDFYFIPQQAGKVRNLPFKVTTFCYHPNTMTENDFSILENFLKENSKRFIKFKDLELKKRSLGLYDRLLRWMYFTLRRMR